MKITEDVRKFVAQQKISEEKALQVGLKQKAREFIEKGSELLYPRKIHLEKVGNESPRGLSHT
jgi:hypothetical protein